MRLNAIKKISFFLLASMGFRRNQIDFFNIWQNTIFMTVYLFIQPSNIERININCFTKFLSLDQLKIIQSYTFPKVLLLSTITALCEANSTANTKCTPAYIVAIAITPFLFFHSIFSLEVNCWFPGLTSKTWQTARRCI